MTPAALGAAALKRLCAALGALVGAPREVLASEPVQTAIAELALLVLVAHRLGAASSIAPLQRQLTSLAGRSFPSGPLPGVTRYAFVGYLVVWLSLNTGQNRWGMSHAELQQFVRESNLCALPRPLYRVIELRYLLDLGRLRHRLPSMGALWAMLRRLRGRSDAIWAETTQAYEATHLVYYLTDFGRAPRRVLGHADRVALGRELETLLARCMAEGHVDLVAEIAAAEPCLRPTRLHAAPAAWQYLATHWRTDKGFNLGEEEGEIEPFLRAYHPALITAVAAIILGRYYPRLAAVCQIETKM